MVNVRNRPAENDLFRLGVYSQVEGNFRVDKYRFTFYLQQISDIKELVNRVIDAQVDDLDKGTFIQFYSKSLYEKLSGLGFYKFGVHNWNIPNSYKWSESLKKEYLRSIIDSLGNLDIDRTTPYIKVQSVNNLGLASIAKIYGGTMYHHRTAGYLHWYGKDTLAICEYLDWNFHCYRNQRGAEIVKSINWERYIW